MTCSCGKSENQREREGVRSGRETKYLIETERGRLQRDGNEEYRERGMEGMKYMKIHWKNYLPLWIYKEMIKYIKRYMNDSIDRRSSLHRSQRAA